MPNRKTLSSVLQSSSTGRDAKEMSQQSPVSEAAQVYKVAQAELRSLPSNRSVYKKRSGLFFLDTKQNVLAETIGKLKAIEKKK